MRHLFFCISLISLYAFRAYSQVDTISLSQAIEIARKNNLSMKIAGTGIKQSELRFHEATRTVRTASAAQVRRPIFRPPSNAERYGALLDPLRKALRM